MTPPVQRLAPDVLLLTGTAVEALRFAVVVAITSRHRNGLRVPDHLAELAAGLADSGQSDGKALSANNTEHQHTRWITTEEAAQMLKCSNRQARRLAPQLSGKLTGGRWLLDRDAVQDHIEGSAA
ncbi:helix-turn-helix domain-containing protein [Rhodococcus opacus]|nr:helix-turn-helix domain-containing protein [Rhodococcus opacus]